MKRLASIFMVIALAALLEMPTASGEEQKRSLRDAILGEWAFDWMQVFGGPKLHEPPGGKSTLVISRESYVVVHEEFDGEKEEPLVACYLLDESFTPARMITAWPCGRYTKEFVRVEGDTLIMCWTALGDKWPKKFEAGPGTNQGLSAYKRIRKP